MTAWVILFRYIGSNDNGYDQLREFKFNCTLTDLNLSNLLFNYWLILDFARCPAVRGQSVSPTERSTEIASSALVQQSQLKIHIK